MCLNKTSFCFRFFKYWNFIKDASGLSWQESKNMHSFFAISERYTPTQFITRKKSQQEKLSDVVSKTFEYEEDIEVRNIFEEKSSMIQKLLWSDLTRRIEKIL